MPLLVTIIVFGILDCDNKCYVVDWDVDIFIGKLLIHLEQASIITRNIWFWKGLGGWPCKWLQGCHQYIHCTFCLSLQILCRFVATWQAINAFILDIPGYLMCNSCGSFCLPVGGTIIHVPHKKQPSKQDNSYCGKTSTTSNHLVNNN